MASEINVSGTTIEVSEYEPGYFIGIVNICGIDHHVELIEVEINPNGEQQARLTDDDGNDLENYNETRWENLGKFNDNEPFATVEVDGRDFVCVITPFAK